MRTIYLIRHGEPELGITRKHVCLGHKDIPLSHEGKKQAERLSRYFKDKDIDYFVSSPLSRCLETAEIIRDKSGNSELSIICNDGLIEINTGEWDGMSFDEIRELYPVEYEKRGKNIGRYVLPGGESFLLAGERFKAAMEKLLEEYDGNMAVVAHAGVIRAYLCLLMGKDIDEITDINIPYASVSVLSFDNCGKPVPVTIGLRPIQSISLSEVDRMRGECLVPPEVSEHMDVVADTAMNLLEYDLSYVGTDILDEKYIFEGSSLNLRTIFYAALLHDIKKTNGHSHASDGAKYLKMQGYEEVARLVERHNDASVFMEGAPLTELEVLYYADKLVKGDSLVTISERFAMSEEKCISQEAKAAHEIRYKAAIGIGRKLGM